MKKTWVKVLYSSLASLLIGVLITSILFMSGVITVNNNEKIEYHLSGVPENIDKTFSAVLDAEPETFYNANLTYKINVSKNLKEMSENSDLIVKGHFKNSGDNSKVTMPVEYTENIVRVPCGRSASFEITELIKGSLYDPENLHGMNINISIKESERIIMGFGEESYADVKDPLFVEPEKDTEYILFLDMKIDEELKYVLYTLSEPLYVSLNDNGAELLCNLKDYNGYFKSKGETNGGNVFQANYYGTKIDFTDDITGKSYEEIKAQIK